MMNKNEINRFKGKISLTIVEAMKLMDENGMGILFIVDDMDKLKGTLTDGDIRRWLINTGELNIEIRELVHRTPRYLKEIDKTDRVSYMVQNHIQALPIIDDGGRIVDIAFNSYNTLNEKQIDKKLLKKIPVIVMAGGKGTRLYPYTKILPKPLIPIGDIPILERILQQFSKMGAEEFYLTVNYRKEMIKSYFSEMKEQYKIKYVNEEHPLGTGGSLRLIDTHFTSSIIVTNCDVLIEADYGEIVRFHKESGNAMTIVSSLKNTVIPYGVIRMQEHGIIESMEEKPVLSHFINTGMYVMEPEYISLIPKGIPYHMTQLAQQMIDKELKVGVYPISENSFLDMGEFEEMKKMEERLIKGVF